MAEFLVQSRLDGLKLFAPGLALIPGFQRNEKESVVTGPDIAEQTETNYAGGVFDSGRVGKNLFYLCRRRAGAFLRSRIGKLHVHIHVALVFIREEAGGQPAGKEHAANDAGCKQGQDQCALPNHAAGEADETVGRTLKIAIERSEKLPGNS